LDVLSDMLSAVRLRSTVFAQTRLPAPWGIRAEGGDFFAFHVIVSGRGHLEVDGLAPVNIEAGEVVVVRPHQVHSLRDRPDTPTVDLNRLLAAGAFGPAGRATPEALAGSAGVADAAVLAGSAGVADAGPHATHLICGCFQFEDMRHNLLLSALPTMIHTRELASEVGPWLAQTIKLLEYESLSDRPGMATVVDRLCDAMFVYVLRSHLASVGTGESNWLRALVEPQIGVALQLLHDEPGRAWTVGTLAKRVAMSRSAFAARFKQVTGEPPMQYLARWRLQKAASMLRTGEFDIADVASRTGYESSAAFSKAFKRTMGLAPGAYRRAPA
jgi:AraC family transcriptional regulator, alkane utilization regulator